MYNNRRNQMNPQDIQSLKDDLNKLENKINHLLPTTLNRKKIPSSTYPTNPISNAISTRPMPINVSNHALNPTLNSHTYPEPR